MTKARRDGLYLLLLGCAVFLILGSALESVAPAPMVDFKVLYFSARCLLNHGDPYNQSQVMRVYEAEVGEHAPESAKNRQIETQFMYLPTAFSVTIPFGMLGFRAAHLLWSALLVGSLILASYLMWDLGADYAPVVSGALICFLLANSELLVIDGNASGFCISTCAVAMWCFYRARWAALGVLCLAVSLALKPHDTGLVWLYLLQAGGVYRKRALQTLGVFAGLTLPGILWVTQVSPHWVQEMHSNMAALAVHGGLNDPSPASSGAHGLGMMINLQTVLSFFRNDPGFYNPATYLICGALLLVWMVTTLRSRVTPSRTWLGLATIAALSLLPVYHREYDATLLLLAVPACGLLWAEGGRLARLALLVTGTAFVLTGDLTWAVILAGIDNVHLSINRQLLTVAQVFPIPLALLGTAVFYLWVYARRATGDEASRNGEPLEASDRRGEAAVQQLP